MLGNLVAGKRQFIEGRCVLELDDTVLDGCFRALQGKHGHEAVGLFRFQIIDTQPLAGNLENTGPGLCFFDWVSGRKATGGLDTLGSRVR